MNNVVIVSGGQQRDSAIQLVFFFFFKLLSSMSSLQILDTNPVSDIWGFPGGAGGILATSKNVPVFLPGESHGQRHLVGYSP